MGAVFGPRRVCSRDPRIATGLAGIAFDVIGRGLRTSTDRVDSARDPLLVEEVAGIVCGQAIPLSALVTARGLLPPLTAHGQRRGDSQPDVRCRRVWRR